jgi:hypothetical protein
VKRDFEGVGESTLKLEFFEGLDTLPR